MNGHGQGVLLNRGAVPFALGFIICVIKQDPVPPAAAAPDRTRQCAPVPGASVPRCPEQVCPGARRPEPVYPGPRCPEPVCPGARRQCSPVPGASVPRCPEAGASVPRTPVPGASVPRYRCPAPVCPGARRQCAPAPGASARVPRGRCSQLSVYSCIDIYVINCGTQRYKGTSSSTRGALISVILLIWLPVEGCHGKMAMVTRIL